MDNKLTDIEIIKALECCQIDNMCEFCYLKSDKKDCGKRLHKDVIDLINRQKAEIERLKSMNQSKLDIIHDVRTDLETAKAEAIKEFAERLKKSLFNMVMLIMMTLTHF